MTDTRFVAFDLETSKPIRDFNDWERQRPLGISCAATLDSGGSLVLWHGPEQPDGRLGDRMSPAECRRLASYLLQMHASRYIVVTWNGLAFDLDILAEECNSMTLRRLLAEMALEHTDIFFALLCETGFLVKLDAVAREMGLSGKLDGVCGEDAPLMWAEDRKAQDTVLNYVGQDAYLTAELYRCVLDQQVLRWSTRSGRPKHCRWENGYVPNVSASLQLPEPDMSWMVDPPSRAGFCAWIHKALPDKNILPLTAMQYRQGQPKPSPQSPRPWTTDEEQRLIDAFDTGASVDDLAVALGRSVNAITVKLHRLGRVLPGERRMGDLPPRSQSY